MTLAEISLGELVDVDRIEAIAARLDLREPNKEALESIVYETAQHYEIEGEPPPLEAVVDVATGVGKTYILAGAIDYFAADGTRNFAVITPGRTILDKTVANFTPGHPKSLIDGMEVRPVVITSDNFNTAAMRATMDDEEQVKLFVFTVQALTKPQTKLGRRTHKFQEGLGEAFYAHLQSLDDLVVFADEHHTYYGPAFSAAVRDLQPWILLGLTATPAKKTPPEQVIYRYPLAAAIADRLVKTPVLVGRKDDRSDPTTKLLDGIRLLELKEQTMRRWCRDKEDQPVNPVMLVIAPKIQEAEEIDAIVKDPSFAGGRYAAKVLTVHSDAPDEALAQLAKLEEPESPYRIVISVGMLKEGWDVKNVYVIASLRASISDILTEQTLGRGMRLPFGRYTGIEMLDTLEVMGHERYEELLKKAGVLNQAFVDWRTRMVERRDAEGRIVLRPESEPVEPPLEIEGRAIPGEPVIAGLDERVDAGEEELEALRRELPPRQDAAKLRIPLLRMTNVKSEFSLADITDLDPFRKLGESIAGDPLEYLRRMVLTAHIRTGQHGLKETALAPAPALDRVESPATLFPLDELRRQLTEYVLAAPVVPARPNEQQAAQPIVEAFTRGLGDQAQLILSGYMDRAVSGLIDLVTEEQRKYASKPSYGEVVEMVEFDRLRTAKAETSDDRFSSFRRNTGYTYAKSLYAEDWFDSSTERDVANILEDQDSIVLWVRLQVDDLPILWSGAGKEYNPDFIAVDKSGVHWIIEVKMDKEMQSADVAGKREAAQRWANHVSADPAVDVKWRYLLLSESDIKTAKGSWAALKKKLA